MKKVLIPLFILSSICSSAQVLRDVDGQPYIVKASEEYVGSPLLFKTWAKANVVNSDGTTYENMMVNIDLVENLLLFLREEKIYSFSDVVNELTVLDDINRVTFKRIKANEQGSHDAFMEVISDLPLILKKYERQLIEVPGYGTNTKTYRYAEGKTYYTSVDKKIKKISLTKENAQIVFAPKWSSTEAFAQQISKCFTTETGWRKMAEHYLSAQ